MSDRDTKDLLGPKGKGKRVAREAPTERLRPVGSEPAPEWKGEHICGAKPKGAEVLQRPPSGWILRIRVAMPKRIADSLGRPDLYADVPVAGCPFCLRELEGQR